MFHCKGKVWQTEANAAKRCSISMRTATAQIKLRIRAHLHSQSKELTCHLLHSYNASVEISVFFFFIIIRRLYAKCRNYIYILRWCQHKMLNILRHLPNLLMYLKTAGCIPWLDAASGVWSGSTLFAQPYLSQYLRILRYTIFVRVLLLLLIIISSSLNWLKEEKPPY